MSEKSFTSGDVEQQALVFLRRMLPEGWIARETPDDPYLDVLIEPAAGGRSARKRFAVMLRGAGLLKQRKGAITLPGVQIEALEHSAAYPDPVMLLLHDTSRDVGYWLWLKPWIESARSRRWEKVSVTSVSIPETNVFDADAIRQIVTDLGMEEWVLAGWIVPDLVEPASTASAEAADDQATDRSILDTVELELSELRTDASETEEMPPAKESSEEAPSSAASEAPSEETAEVEPTALEDDQSVREAEFVLGGEPALAEHFESEAVIAETGRPAEVTTAAVLEDEVSPVEPEIPPAPRQTRPPFSLALQFQALLQSVAASNYLNFGAVGVRRFGPRGQDLPDTDTATLTAPLDFLRDDGSVILTIPDLTFQRDESGDQRVVWVARSPAYGLQGVWIWDFYRLLSHLYLRIHFVPPPTPAQESILEALQALAPGDTVCLCASLPTGDLDQRHPVTVEVLAARDSGLAGRSHAS